MNNIPEVLLKEIKEHLELRDIYDCLATNKFLNKLYVDDFKQRLSIKKNFVLKLFPEIIIELFNGLPTLIFSPQLKFKESFVGLDYIDAITSTDVNYPIMIGVDSWRRPYITVKTRTLKSEFTGSGVSVVTLFQRYTGSPSTWTYGTCYYCTLINRSSESHVSTITGYKPHTYDSCKLTILVPNLKENIKRLLNNKGSILCKRDNPDRNEEIPFWLWKPNQYS